MGNCLWHIPWSLTGKSVIIITVGITQYKRCDNFHICCHFLRANIELLLRIAAAAEDCSENYTRIIENGASVGYKLYLQCPM